MSEELAVVYPRIDAALATVEEELGILETERTALDRFRSRLQGLDSVVTTRSTGGAGPTSTATVSGADPADVRAAYRDTVLAMDHYDREYGEPLLVHVALEFGPQVVGILGGDVPLSSMQLDVVEGAIDQRIEERRAFTREIATERDSLESVSRRLGAIERAFYEDQREPGPGGEGATEDRGTPTSSELVADCEALAAERQDAIHSAPVSAHAGVDEESLVEYLYGDTDCRFPALAEIADVAERISPEADVAVTDDPASATDPAAASHQGSATDPAGDGQTGADGGDRAH